MNGEAERQALQPKVDQANLKEEAERNGVFNLTATVYSHLPSHS